MDDLGDCPDAEALDKLEKYGELVGYKPYTANCWRRRRRRRRRNRGRKSFGLFLKKKKERRSSFIHFCWGIVKRLLHTLILQRSLLCSGTVYTLKFKRTTLSLYVYRTVPTHTGDSRQRSVVHTQRCIKKHALSMLELNRLNKRTENRESSKRAGNTRTRT